MTRSIRSRTFIGFDQMLSSATNFGVSALAAGLLSASDFGAFAIAIATYVIFLGTNRAWTGNVLIILPPAATASEARDHAIGASTASLFFGLAAGGVTAAIGVVLGGSVGSALIGLGCFLPALLVQDTLRYALMAQNAAGKACWSDGTWLVISVSLLMVLRVTNTESVLLAMGTWGLGAVGGALVARLAFGSTFHGSGAGRWLRKARPLSSRMVLEFGVVTISGYSMLIMVTAWIDGTAAGGGVRGAQVLLGPLTVIVLASSIYLQPQMARLNGEHRSVRHLAVRQSVSNTLITILWIAVAASTPAALGTRVFGRTWQGAQANVIWLGLAFLAAAATSGATSELRSRHLVVRSLVARSGSSVVVVAATLVGGSTGGGQGALEAFALSSLTIPVATWASVSRSGQAAIPAAARVRGAVE